MLPDPDPESQINEDPDPKQLFDMYNFYLHHYCVVTWNMVRWLPLLVSATTPRSPVRCMSALICWVDRPVELASAFTRTPSPIPSSIPSQAGASLKGGFFVISREGCGVADPGCLSQIPDLTFFHPGSRIRIKEFKYFIYFNTQKMVSKL